MADEENPPAIEPAQETPDENLEPETQAAAEGEEGPAAKETVGDTTEEVPSPDTDAEETDVGEGKTSVELAPENEEAVSDERKSTKETERGSEEPFSERRKSIRDSLLEREEPVRGERRSSKVSGTFQAALPEEKIKKPVAEPTREKPPKTSVEAKKESVKRLFDSKGSLLEAESYVKGKLEAYKKKRAAIAAMISDLQAKLKAYKEKENLTDDDIANLKKYHAEFQEKFAEYDEMTRNVEKWMGMAKIPSQIEKPAEKPKATKKPEPLKPVAGIEEKLPKLIVCGADVGDTVPRIIVCEPLNRSHTEPFYDHDKFEKGIPSECDLLVKERLKEAHETLQKLAAENREINDMRQQLQRELFAKQDMLENMKHQMMACESEKYRVQNENSELQKRLMICGAPKSPKPGEGKICKRELYKKYRDQTPDGTPFCGTATSQDLEQESDMGDGVDMQNMCCQLENKEMENLPLGCCMSPRQPVCKRTLPQKSTQTDADKERDICFDTDKDPKYKELREQYQRLHNDFKKKVTEVACLRVDLDKTRTELEEITVLHHELEARHQQELESNYALIADKNKSLSSKDQIMDLEQAACAARQMYITCQEEVEEMRLLIEDQTSQLDEYRNKYLKTLQIAEELKKENEFKERECSDQIAIEIQKVKLEMQEQLEELRPIKELLKVTQQKLKETEQMHTIALETLAEQSQRLETALQELEVVNAKIENAETDGEVMENLQHSLEEAEKRLIELEKENEQLKKTVNQLERLQTEQNQRMEAKNHEALQLMSQLETLREESARQVSRLKERYGMMRKCLQLQIAEMEGEVAVCRAEASRANKERDEIRAKLQLEICLLSENFHDSQNRILQLQQHVSYLSASHPTAFIDLCDQVN